MTTQPGPAARRRQLGSELKRLRIAAGFKTLAAASSASGLSRATVSRIESNKQAILPRTVSLLGQTYGASGVELAELIQLAEGADERGWIAEYAKILPDWFDRYVVEEAEAASILSYEAEYVPGLFQIPEYCWAVSAVSEPDQSEEYLQQLVDFRKQRQARLDGENPPQLVTVLNEAVLRRRVGGKDVMRRQLERLLELAGNPHNTIRVLPFDAGEHPAMTGSFALLKFPEDTPATTIFVEVKRAAMYPASPDEHEHYAWMFDWLMDHALTAQKTKDLISRLVAEL
jgi:transcriptional regulator with XRE-family HTH domain